MSGALEQVRHDIEMALRQQGTPARQLQLVSSLGARKGSRLAFRADLCNGQIVKARHFANSQEAQQVFDLRGHLAPAFAPALALHGAVILEQWIDGERLDERHSAKWVARAGGMLAAVHRTACAGRVVADTSRWSTAAVADTVLLRDAGVLDAATAAILLQALRRFDPGAVRLDLVHMDFCADNMLIDRQDELRIIDNERVSLGPAGLDLGWTQHRWPLSDAAWSELLEAYAGVAELPPGRRFWRLIAALTCTRVYCQLAPERVDDSMARLSRTLDAVCNAEAE